MKWCPLDTGIVVCIEREVGPGYGYDYDHDYPFLSKTLRSAINTLAQTGHVLEVKELLLCGVNLWYKLDIFGKYAFNAVMSFGLPAGCGQSRPQPYILHIA